MNREKVSRRSALKTAALSTAGLSLTGFAGTPRSEAPHGTSTASGLRGKVALAAGGARGIGASTAEALAKAGAHVVLFDVASDVPHVPYPLATPDELQAARQRVEAHGVRCLAVQGDVRRLADLEHAVAETERAFGPLDLVVASPDFSREAPARRGRAPRGKTGGPRCLSSPAGGAEYQRGQWPRFRLSGSEK